MYVKPTADPEKGAGKDDAGFAKRSVAWSLLSNAAHLYRLRLRDQPVTEVLALAGIAAGVALLFAVQVLQLLLY